MKIMLSILFFFILHSCVGMNGFGKKKPEIDQLILQENIQRFYARFTERIVEGFRKDPRFMDSELNTILTQYLLYDQEALKIATAPYPEVNLLDMMVFIKLNKEVVKRYWIPEVMKEDGWGLYQAFVNAEKDIDQLALTVMEKEQLQVINTGVRKWLNENPDSMRVEKIRVADFSKFATAAGAKDFSFSLSQLFVDTKSAVKAVDQVTLVGNRALFLAQHMPLLIRLHARLGTQEMIRDTVTNYQSSPLIIESIHAATPLVHNLTLLTKELQSLMQKINARIPASGGHGVNATLNKADSIILNSRDLISDIQKVNPDLNPIKGLISFIAVITIVVAAAASILWWGGYYICKRMLHGPLKKETL